MKTESIKLAIILSLLAGVASAQSDAPPPPQTGNQQDATREPRRRPDVIGTITAVNGQTLTIKNPDGHNVTVTVTDTTRFMKDRQPAKFGDFKVGDMAMVRGRSTGTDAWEAEFLGSRSAGSGGPGAFSQGGFAQDLGKKFIVGEIKSIDGLRLTIARPDGETQTIAVDENTSFKKEGESITLADFKAGDHVFGPGEVKDGTFVASRLMIGDMRRMRGGPEGTLGPDPK
jgi:outer membrane lipoprotein SlyB